MEPDLDFGHETPGYRVSRLAAATPPTPPNPPTPPAVAPRARGSRRRTRNRFRRGGAPQSTPPALRPRAWPPPPPLPARNAKGFLTAGWRLSKGPGISSHLRMMVDRARAAAKSRI